MTVPTQPCPATKRNGQICNSTRISQSGFCFAHDPEANSWRRMGGYARQRKAREARKLDEIEKVRDPRLDSVVESLQESLSELAKESPTPSNIRAMARLADSIAQIIYHIADDPQEELQHVIPPDWIEC